MAAEIRFNDNDVVKWDMALLKGESSKGFSYDEFMGFEVENGLACFMDEKVMEMLDLMSEEELEAYEAKVKEAVRKSDNSLADIIMDEKSSLNIIAVSYTHLIYTTVSDLDVLYIAQDAPVTVTVDALPGETFEGEVMRLDSYTDYRTGETVYNVQIKVEGREGLRPGMNTCLLYTSRGSLGKNRL